MIRGVKFVSIPVSDQGRSLRFFTEKLGFIVHTDQPYDDKQRWIELSIPGAESKVVLFTMEGQEAQVGGFFNGAFWSRDVKKTFEELREKGVSFIQPPETADWGTSAIFEDPDGTYFVLSSK